LELRVVDRGDTQRVQMLVLGLALDLRGRDPIINRIAVPLLARAMPQPDDPAASHAARRIAAVLRPHQLAEPRVAFIRPAVVHTQKGLLAIVHPVFHQPPYLAGHKPLLPQ
jgi:hypothetical protein